MTYVTLTNNLSKIYPQIVKKYLILFTLVKICGLYYLIINYMLILQRKLSHSTTRCSRIANDFGHLGVEVTSGINRVQTTIEYLYDLDLVKKTLLGRRIQILTESC